MREVLATAQILFQNGIISGSFRFKRDESIIMCELVHE